MHHTVHAIAHSTRVYHALPSKRRSWMVYLECIILFNFFYSIATCVAIHITTLFANIINNNNNNGNTSIPHLHRFTEYCIIIINIITRGTVYTTQPYPHAGLPISCGPGQEVHYLILALWRHNDHLWTTTKVWKPPCCPMYIHTGSDFTHGSWLLVSVANNYTVLSGKCTTLRVIGLYTGWECIHVHHPGVWMELSLLKTKNSYRQYTYMYVLYRYDAWCMYIKGGLVRLTKPAEMWFMMVNISSSVKCTRKALMTLWERESHLNTAVLAILSQGWKHGSHVHQTWPTTRAW